MDIEINVEYLQDFCIIFNQIYNQLLSKWEQKIK